MLKHIWSVVGLLVFAQYAFGHGEDKAGPNGGFIQMPGAFHTEIVQIEKDIAKVYLLDMNFQNPSIKASVVEVKLGSKTSLKCQVQTEPYFLCQFPKGTDLSKKGRLLVKAQREGQKGNDVTYELPLKLKTGHH